ncbi:MAG: LysM peptidoglycan-binding domain-containing protein [Chloroflexi bacterium]|nr:LysM peptidoglycan-binding domain-containing protein [Chloroflexota bacterium]
MKAMTLRRSFFLLVASFILLVTLPSAAHASGLAAEPTTIHRVQKGETLNQIASKYGTTVDSLKQLNNLRNVNVIYVGQRLVIKRGTTDNSSSPGNTGVHVVRRGETLSGIARNNGTTASAIQAANNLHSSVIFVGQRLKIPSGAANGGASQGVVHVVKKGETLGSIAAAYGSTVAQLKKLNGIKNASLVKVGQRLKITPAAKPAKKIGPKKIVVDISQQRCWRYEGEVMLDTWRCSTGQRRYGTKTGTFRVQSKLRKAFGSSWNIWMPYWLGIYWSGSVENGFHGLPWKANSGRKIWGGLVGTPATFGCVMLRDAPMKKLWNWADIGTKVVIKY